MAQNQIARVHESAAPQSGGATVTGTTWDMSADPAAYAGTPADGTSGGAGASRFRAFAAADVAGTLIIQQSADKVNWFKTISQPVLADFTQGTVLESMPVLRYVRAVFTNGATNQASFEFDTSVVSI